MKNFSQVGNHGTPLLIHTWNKDCDKTFSKSGGNPFSCDECQKQFRSSKDLTEHVMAEAVDLLEDAKKTREILQEEEKVNNNG